MYSLNISVIYVISSLLNSHRAGGLGYWNSDALYMKEKGMHYTQITYQMTWSCFTSLKFLSESGPSQIYVYAMESILKAASVEKEMIHVGMLYSDCIIILYMCWCEKNSLTYIIEWVSRLPFNHKLPYLVITSTYHPQIGASWKIL